MKSGCSTSCGTRLGWPWLLATVLWASFAAPAAAVECEQIRYRGCDYTACRVDTKVERLELFYLKPTGERFHTLAGLHQDLANRQVKLLFATNAGIFTPAFRPLGLYVENSVEQVPLTSADGAGNFYLKPNGVFALTDDGPLVVESSEVKDLSPKVRFATQSGPLLLHRGEVHPAFNMESTNKTVRSGVGTLGQTAIFVLSRDDVTFYDLAALFRDRLHCRDALYLDGAISEMLLPDSTAPSGGHEFAAMFGVIARPTQAAAKDE